MAGLRAITWMLLVPLPACGLLSGTHIRKVLTPRTADSSPTTEPLPGVVPSNVKRLILVRHGEVDLSQFGGRKVFYGGAEVPLSQQGRREAAAAARVIAEHERVDVVWASPLSRASFGAELVAAAQAKKRQAEARPLIGPVAHEGFKEVNRGEWFGKFPGVEVSADEIARWNRDPDFRPPGSEALADVAVRVLSARDELLAQVPWGSTVCLVSHMWVTRSLVADALGCLDLTTQGDTSKLQDIDIPTASISVVEYTRCSDPFDTHGIGAKAVVYAGRKPPVEKSDGDARGG